MSARILPRRGLLAPMREVVRAHRRLMQPRRAFAARQRGFILGYSRGGGGAPFLVDAADFDGAGGDFALNAAGGFTGAAASQKFTLVFWLNWDAFTEASPNGILVLNSNDQGLVVSAITGPKIRVVGAAPGTILDIESTNAFSAGAWTCFLISVDLSDTAKRHLYHGDTSNLTVTTYLTSDNIAFHHASGHDLVGALDDVGTGELDSGVAELWFEDGVYTDFSLQANRRKWYGTNGKPANVGTDGSTPTGTSPLVYFHLDDGETANNFLVNAGTGGNLTLQGGTLTTRASSPSD